MALVLTGAPARSPPSYGVPNADATMEAAKSCVLCSFNVRFSDRQQRSLDGGDGA